MSKEKEGDWQMQNFVLFLNSFLSYLLLMVIIAVIAGIAIFIGVKARKNKNTQNAREEKTGE